MLMHARTAATPHRVLLISHSQPPERSVAWLDTLGEVDNEAHIILLGPDGPDFMCALLRAGAPSVAHLCSYERLEANSASMIIVPRSTAAHRLEEALPALRRALIPNGRLIVAVDPARSLQSRLAKWLKLQAFASISTIRGARLCALTAEVSAYGHHRTA